jgi:hypothetical protein
VRGAPEAPPSAARPDRTSTVVAGTLIFLTALGVLTVFWEPLAALAVGTTTPEAASEPHAPPVDAGAATPVDASGNS